jgi:RNA polymerase sigma-70 factor (ECF subfamily)
MSPSDPDDNTLIRRTREGDIDAFGVLALRYRRRATGLAYRFVGNVEDARDVSQDAFAKAYASLDSYRDGTRFDRWLLRIVANGARDMLRARSRRGVREPVDSIAALPADSLTPDRAAELGDLNSRLAAELSLLPYRQRMAFVLHEQEDMPHAEIASLLDEKVGTVRWLLFRAREQLRDRLSDLLETDE